MTIQFIIIGLNETEVMTGASLCSNGITEYKEMYVIGKFIDKVNTWDEGSRIAQENCHKFEHGCEVRQIFVNKEIVNKG